MDSTSYAYPGNEHSSYPNTPQTASLRDVNNEESTGYPNQPLSLHGFNQAGISGTSSPYAAQNTLSAEQQITGEPTNLQPLPQIPQKPKKRGRGYTGKPKGRPPGARNKPRGPDHGLPKEPKRKGRPLGAKNKYPRGAHGAFPPTPDSNSSPAESGSSHSTTPVAAGTPLAMAPPSTPTEAQTTYTAPLGYAQVTEFSASLDPADRGYDQKTNSWYSIKARARDEEFLRMSATSTPPENLMTPMATPSPAPTTSPYANQAGHGQPGYLGYQYPPPPDPNQALGSGNFTYNLYDYSFNNYNSYNHTSSSDPFTSSSTFLGATPANWDQPQPRRPILPSPAASRAYEASRSAFNAGDGLSRLRPQSSIDPKLRAGAQNNPPAPATPATDDANTTSAVAKENDMDEMVEEGIPEFDPMSFLKFDGLESGFWRE